MTAFRCTRCSENWPPTAAYTSCPYCGKGTRPSTRTAMPPGDARAVLNQQRFVEYYQRTRGAHPDAE